MNQQKTGAFLKYLRKSKGLTQEQLAEHFGVSSRTVSRWETGSNMPDVDMIIDLADFYDVDIREIIDGERISDDADIKTNETLKRVATYAATKERCVQSNVVYAALGVTVALYLCTILFASEKAGLLYGIVPEQICKLILILTYALAVCLFVSYLKVHWFLEKPSQEPEITTAATVISKEVKQGTHQTGRSKGGYSYAITFLTPNGQKLELFAYELEFGAMKEGMKGELTYKGRYFVFFK